MVRTLLNSTNAARPMTFVNSIEKKDLTVLGIETSCDETAAAVVTGPAEKNILSNVIRSQVEEHGAFGGVVPEIAARAHIEVLDHIAREAMAKAGCEWDDIDAVAATAGPGLIGGVIVGFMTAKAIAMAAGKPLIAVNHLEGHALTARLTDNLEFPFLLLLVSGGHSQFLLVRGVGDYERWGTTIDDAIGEAFDKTAKLLGLPYPGGPAVERMARRGDAARFKLPRPLLDRDGLDMSFAGLKTALRTQAKKNWNRWTSKPSATCAPDSRTRLPPFLQRARTARLICLETGFQAFSQRLSWPGALQPTRKSGSPCS